jgi:hypothetical protein
MNMQAGGWFVVLDPAASTNSQKYYVKLSTSDNLILSLERGGQELYNIDASKYNYLGHKETEGGRCIKLAKHDNERVPNVEIVAATLEQHEQMYQCLKNCVLSGVGIRNNDVPEVIKKLLRKLKSRLDLNILNLYEIRRLSHMVERGLRDNKWIKQAVGKELSKAETSALEALSAAKARFSQGIHVIDTNNEYPPLKDQLQDIEKMIERSWIATHNFVLSIGKKDIAQVIKDWESIALESESNMQKKLRAMLDKNKQRKNEIIATEKKQKYLLLDYKGTKAKTKRLAESSGLFKTLNQTFQKAMAYRKERKNILEDNEKKNKKVDELTLKSKIKGEINVIDADLQVDYDEILADLNNEISVLNEELLLMEQQEREDFATELSDRDISLSKGLLVDEYDDDDNENYFRQWYLNSFHEEYDIEKRRAIDNDSDTSTSSDDDSIENYLQTSAMLKK